MAEFECPGQYEVEGIETRGQGQFAVSLRCVVSFCSTRKTFSVNGYSQGGITPEQDAVSNAESTMIMLCPVEQMLNK